MKKKFKVESIEDIKDDAIYHARAVLTVFDFFGIEYPKKCHHAEKKFHDYECGAGCSIYEMLCLGTLPTTYVIRARGGEGFTSMWGRYLKKIVSREIRRAKKAAGRSSMRHNKKIQTDSEIKDVLRDYYKGKHVLPDKVLQNVRILILEDDLSVLSLLIDKLRKLENQYIEKDLAIEIAVTILSESTQVEEYANRAKNISFDIILLDRDCKSCGSFHCLDFEKYGIENIISISAISVWNDQARKAGIETVIYKSLDDLESFSDKVAVEVDKRVKSIKSY